MSKVLAVAGHSGSGKTSLIQAMLPELAILGVTTSVIKHTHHDVELEPPHKDSARFRVAGAHEVMLSSPHRYAIVRELDGVHALTLAQQLERLSPCDLVLIEGFHADPIPRIEVFRPALGRAPRCQGDPQLIALVSDVAQVSGYEVWPLNEPAQIALRICRFLGIQCETQT